MGKGKKHHYNRLFLDKLAYTGNYSTPTTISSWAFSAKECHFSPQKTASNIPVLPDDEHCLWIQVCGLTTLETIVALGKRFDINQSDLQDILTADHVTKISVTEKNLLLIVKDFYYDDREVLNVEHVCLLLYKNYVISFQESDRPIFELVGKALENNTNKVRERSVDYLFGILLDAVINNCVDIIGNIEQSLEYMEECLIDPGLKDGNVGPQILSARKNIQRMKRFIIPFKEQLPRFIHPDDTDLIRKENLPYLVDINDHLQLAVQLLEACREEANAVFDLHIANNDLRMNEIMKRLTVVSTIFIPLTFIVGVWGMNFKFMPETEWDYGYLLAWIILIVVGLATWWYLLKRKWF
ncbi:MAG: magnesium/cobalt transporter CorA [Tannerella sp.]|jgi:magnesium transporter|nr:magnesium/cobalt transporter CorA [Tannerella sp.]